MEVTFLDSMGSDLTVVNAARVSFDKLSDWEVVGEEKFVDYDSREVTYVPITKLSEKDANLIQFLAKNGHWSPFGHVTTQFRIKAPIFVARQLVKHQVGLCWNEVSRRYVDSTPEFFMPDKWRAKAANVKQGSDENNSVETLVVHTGCTREPPEFYYSIGETAESNGGLDNLGVCDQCGDSIYKETFGITELVNELNKTAESLYTEMLAEGVCPEQARMVLPQSMFTEWIWTGSLFAFARVCKLRLDSHAQAETRVIAQRINDEMVQRFPVSWKALME